MSAITCERTVALRAYLARLRRKALWFEIRDVAVPETLAAEILGAELQLGEVKR
jgi:hypothetical protein